MNLIEYSDLSELLGIGIIYSPKNDSKRNSIKCPKSPMNIGTDSRKSSS